MYIIYRKVRNTSEKILYITSKLFLIITVVFAAKRKRRKFTGS